MKRFTMNGVNRYHIVLLTALCAAIGATGAAQAVAVFRIAVFDVATNTPIPAVTVRIAGRDGKVMIEATTDADGVLERRIVDGQDVQVEYEKITYVRRPERVRLSVKKPGVVLKGYLLKDDGTPQYYRKAAEQVDARAMDLGEAQARETLYSEEWNRTASLSMAQRSAFANGLSQAGQTILNAEPSFLVALGAQKWDLVASGDPRNDAIDKASKRLIYEVVLHEQHGSFKFGRATLPDEAKAEVDKLITKLPTDPKSVWIEIEGHSDSAGSVQYNEQLGQERAEAVKLYLYKTYKVPLHRMNVISYGESKPVAPNKTREGRAENRRVVIRVLGQEG